MLDKFDREINYLRISVIDRCNLNCVYCGSQDKYNNTKQTNILSFEEIVKIVTIAVNDFGFKKIRLTGGEPLVRHNIIKLVSMLSSIAGIEDFAMSTNGILLHKYAQSLLNAGLNRVNVSLDTTDAIKFSQITKGGNINDVFNGINTALNIGLTPIKINCVIQHNADEKDAQMVKKYADYKGLMVRFIKRMNFIKGQFSKIDGGIAGDCLSCNRIRLLSNGEILPCLFSDITFSIKQLGIHKAIEKSINHKPQKGTACKMKHMITIGG